ncbi:MAG: type II secretion system protein GspE [Chitinivibrionales bacterium]|nr:type II secretion system protein GspE [Chitinivibrionales bacterium]
MMKLGELLTRKKITTDDVVERAVRSALEQHCLLGDILVQQHGLSEEHVYRALAEQFGMPFFVFIEEKVDNELLRDLPSELFRDGRCFPLGLEENILDIAVGDPLDLDIVLDAQVATGYTIRTSLSAPSEMERIRQKYFAGDNAFKRTVGKLSKDYQKTQINDDMAMTIDEIRKRTESEPVVKMASLIFDEAIRLRASDVHIEPTEYHAVVRMRIDGMLRQHMDIEPGMYLPLTSRIKIQADLDIAEKRVPQDGRIRYSYKGYDYDFRVSTLPTHYGEKTVVRVLKHDEKLLDIANLGFDRHVLENIEEVIEKPQGMIFVTGPTGSGKSSTLFACLNRIRHKEINITTIENPIEHKLPGINQVQINEKAGVTFASTLRAILRQDPDVVLIGEIRDNETAGIAIRASQTGHLVFSTLHTNDAVSAIARLRDLDIPGFLISSSLLAILAQRLVRVLCPVCRVKGEPSEEVRHKWKMLLGEVPIPPSYQAAGCAECENLGYKGRTGIFELITVNEELRAIIGDNGSESAIRKMLRTKEHKTLIQNGILKIEEGVTTPEELLRVVLVDDAIELRNRQMESSDTVIQK